MKKLQITILLIIAFAGNSTYAQNSETIRQYILKYKDLAIEEMVRTGVPASITLAQGIHETAAGTSNLVLSSNNHFGIKCKSEWKGESVYHDDDARGECFRKYNDPAQSYRDHSDFLRNRPYYASLFNYSPTDFESWAYGLKKAGYATNPKYPQILIKLIKDYHLQDYTLIALNGTNDKKADWAKVPQTSEVISEKADPVISTVATQNYPSRIFTINNTKVVLVEIGTAFLKIAEENNIPLARLFEYNEMEGHDIAEYDQLIYLQRKKKSSSKKFHVVIEGETLYDIAQMEGVQLQSLLEYNYLKDGMEPEAGEKIYLSSKAQSIPRLAAASSQPTYTPATKEVEENGEYNFVVHTVQPKETIYGIAKKYDVEMDDVIRWNDMSSKDLKIGQQLRIQKKATNAIY